MKEFSGKVSGINQYDFDMSFSIIDPKLGKIELHFKNGSCTAGEDRYELVTDITDELRETLMSEDGWSNVKVKVTAKSTYGFQCGGCDDCKPKKVMIWRPVKVTRIY